jgi:hypothetical protein
MTTDSVDIVVDSWGWRSRVGRFRRSVVLGVSIG